MNQASGPEGEQGMAAGPARPGPDKERVRHWLAQRRLSHQPPPEPAAIRRELGWTSQADAEAVAAPAA
jgi:hypothetical protein